MKEVEVLQRINGISEDLIEEASTFTVIRKKMWKVYFATAASVLLIVGLLSGWIYYFSNKVELDANGKIDIYSIKKAQVIKEVLETSFSTSASDMPGPPEEYVAMHREWIEAGEEIFVYGTVKNIKMIKLEDYVHDKGVSWVEEDGTIIMEEEDFPATWWIVTFDIDVIDDMQTLDGVETVHVVLACRYTTKAKFASPYIIYNPKEMEKMLTKIQSNPTGLFVLKDQTREPENESVWEIKGKEYRAVDFADYFVKLRYDCDGEKFQYACGDSFTVYLDELRMQKEE